MAVGMAGCPEDPPAVDGADDSTSTLGTGASTTATSATTSTSTSSTGSDATSTTGGATEPGTTSEDGSSAGSDESPIDPTLDRDDDGLTDLEEITVWGTSPVVADTDGDGFSDWVEVVELAFDPEVDNFQFNPRIAERPQISIALAAAPTIFVRYETSGGATHTIGRPRSMATRPPRAQPWGGVNAYAAEQSHAQGVALGFDDASRRDELTYDDAFAFAPELSSTWTAAQEAENQQSLGAMGDYEAAHADISARNAGMDIEVTVANPGDFAYFLEGLTLSVYRIDALRPTQPISWGPLTLVGAAEFPRTRLDPEDRSSALTFHTDLPLEVAQGLLENSPELMVAPASWLIADDGTVDFDFASTAINARTATIVIDYGFGRATEHYRITTVAHEDRNYITVDEALSEILRVPYQQGVVGYRRSNGEMVDTELMLTQVRDFATSDADAVLWNVVHSYPINNGADVQTDLYHPFTDALDFGALQLQKGHTLHLVRILDQDRDGLGERAEYAYGTDPAEPDTDGDGCSDGLEVAGWTVGLPGGDVVYRSDPRLANTDADPVGDCDERENGTDPQVPDNDPPSATVSVVEADGVRAVFRVDYEDTDTEVTELRYSVDDQFVGTVSASGASGSRDIEVTFETAGEHSFAVVPFDGVLEGAAATVTYTVGVPQTGLTHHWPIVGASDDVFFGDLPDVVGGANASATSIGFVTGADGLGRGAAHTNFQGDSGILYTPALSLGAAYSFTAWIRFDAIYSDMWVAGQFDRFALLADPGGIAVHDMYAQTYPSDTNRVIDVDLTSRFGAEWDERDAFYRIVLTVSGTTARLYVDGVEAGTGSMSESSAVSCSLIVGHPAGGEPQCGSVDPAEDFENGLNAAFDELRIYDRALTANEVVASGLE